LNHDDHDELEDHKNKRGFVVFEIFVTLVVERCEFSS